MIAWLIALASASTGGVYDAYPDTIGGLSVHDEDTPLAAVGFRAFAPGWQWVGPTRESDGSVVLRFPGGERARLERTLTAAGDGVQARFEAVAQQSVAVQTVFLGVELPGRWWAGGTARFDGQLVSLPVSFGSLGLHWGTASQIEFRKGERWLRLSLPQPRSVYLQDSRQWGASFELRIEAHGQGTWAAGHRLTVDVGIGGDRPLRLHDDGPVVIGPGPEWVPYQAANDVLPGSALDFSPAQIVPAGTYGRVHVKGRRFEFFGLPGVRQRFVGANLCFTGAVPTTRDRADRIVERLVRAGYNAVRLHHFDVELTGGWQAGNSGSSTALDPAALDRFDYLFSRLKANGLYVKIDLYSLRQIRRDEVFPGTIGSDEYKLLLLVDPGARANWWAFARNLLEHVNPYTGLAYKDDPALAWIAVVNENNIGSAWLSAGPAVRSRLNQAWQDAGGTGGFDPLNRDECARFGAMLHEQTFVWMRDRLRSIGVRALLTDTNGWRSMTALAVPKRLQDFGDEHHYWDHPQLLAGSWTPPSRHHMRLSLRDLAASLNTLGFSRGHGKPFTVSEFNYTFPNPFRAEGGLLFGAVAAAQDWDALWRFAWSHDDFVGPHAANWFDIQKDPMRQLSERALIALFLRGDLTPAGTDTIVILNPTEVGREPIAGPAENPFLSRWNHSLLPTTRPRERAHRQVAADPDAGRLVIHTPRTEGIMARPGETVDADRLSVRFGTARGTAWVSSLDGQTIATSRRMLFVHLTDLLNTGTTFAGPDRTVLSEFGQLPHLVRHGTADVSLRLTGTAAPRVFRLRPNGARGTEAAASWSGGVLSFRASVRPEGPGVGTDAVMAYEIVR